MQSNKKRMVEIYNKYTNGNKKEMVEEIDIYGLYDFWNDLVMYLDNLLVNNKDKYSVYQDITIIYFRIKNR